jgi:hypothetical protein
MAERVDYSVDELSRIPFKQRPVTAVGMFSKSLPHWKDEFRLRGQIDPEKPPSLNVAAIRKIKRLAVVDFDLGIRSMTDRPMPVDWKEADLLASQCLQAVGMSLKLCGFSVITQDVVARLIRIEPDWTLDAAPTRSEQVFLHVEGGSWMSWPFWIEKPLLAKDRALRLMNTLGVDGLVWVSSRVLLVRNSTQQAIFSAEPFSYGEWWQHEFSGQPTWTNLGVELTVVTRMGLSSDRLVAWSASTKGDWTCPPIMMNRGTDPTKSDYEFRLSYSRYPILASFRVIMETMAAQFRKDSTK